jgi:hypothetical protein
MISMLVTLIIYLLIVGLLLALVFYVVDAIPIPDPFGRFLKIAIIVIACLVVILLLLQMVGGGNFNLPKVG